MENFMSFTPDSLKTPQLHAYLLSAVAPRPIALVSTIDSNGTPNLSPFSFFNIFSANPPVAIFSPARSGRTGATKNTFDNVKEVAQAVINVVNYNIVQQTSLSSTEYPKGVNEFIKSGLTPIKSDIVQPFRVKESPVQLECVVKNVVELGTQGGAGNLVICEIVKVHINHSIMNESQTAIDTNKIDLVGRMGSNWYCRASGNALFEIEKPVANLGVGVDAIPQAIRNSNILTGNNLGQLGNIEKLPEESEIIDFLKTELKNFFTSTSIENKTVLCHSKAKEYLDSGEVSKAWKTLLSINYIN